MLKSEGLMTILSDLQTDRQTDLLTDWLIS